MRARVKINGNSPYGEWEPGDTGVVDGYCRGGNDVPLFLDGYECKKWKQTNRKDTTAGFKPVESMREGTYYTKHSSLTIKDIEKL